MFKRLLEWIRRPHGWRLVLFYLFTAGCIAGALYFCAVGAEGGYGVAPYIFYGLAAVTLGYTVYTVVLFVPKIRRRAAELLGKNKFTERLCGQYAFRTLVFAVGSMAISLINAVLNCAMGFVNRSVWFGALGAYYLLLFSMRFGILLYYGKKRRHEEKLGETQMKLRELQTYRVCGVLLVLLPLVLSSAILEMVVSERAFVRSGMMIYVSSVYTFYKITMSVYNLFKARKNDEMTVRAVRNVNLADALVSILALQTAMFHEFSKQQGIGYANAITGAVVSALTAALGIFMIVYGSRLIIRLKKEKLTNDR